MPLMSPRRAVLAATGLGFVAQLPLACGGSGAPQVVVAQAGATAQGGAASSDAGQGPLAPGGGASQAECSELLSPDFRLVFEEVPLDGEPQELTDFKFVP